MHPIIDALSARSGTFTGRGINHEGEQFTGKMTILTAALGSAVTIEFFATGDDGTVFHAETTTIAPTEPGGDPVLRSVGSNLGFALDHFLLGGASTSERWVFGAGDIDDESRFREQITLAVDPEGEGTLAYVHAWGLSGEGFAERSSVVLHADRPPGRRFETGALVHEFLDTMKALDVSFLGGPRAVVDDASILEGYKWIFSIAQVGLDAFVWGDKARPHFVDIVGRTKKWGGDNADAFYCYAPIDPARTYRVTADRGDAVYWALTVYGGPDDGRYSERIVGSLSDRSEPPAFGADGRVEMILSPDDPGQGVAWLRLEPDAVAAITRDYLVDPTRGKRMDWSIECLDPAPPFREDDADLARRFRAALTWLRDQAAIAPIPLGEPNQIDPPYPVPTATFGWAAGDAAYAMGSFVLGPGEALVVEGRSPECAFWNLCLWNQFLHTYNYDRGRVTINGGQVTYEPDGSWRIVISETDPCHPNWVSTQGHTQGRIWFRWFHPSDTPDRPTTRVVKLPSTF